MQPIKQKKFLLNNIKQSRVDRHDVITTVTTVRVLNEPALHDSYEDVTKEQTIIVLRWDRINFLAIIFFGHLKVVRHVLFSGQ